MSPGELSPFNCRAIKCRPMKCHIIAELRVSVSIGHKQQLQSVKYTDLQTAE